MSVVATLKSLLKNQYVLYALIAVSAVQVYGFYAMEDTQCLSLFVIASLGSYLFSKNHAVNLLAGLLATNFLFAGKCVREGMKGDEEGEEEEGDEDELEEMGHMEGLGHAEGEEEASEEGEEKEPEGEEATEGFASF